MGPVQEGGTKSSQGSYEEAQYTLLFVLIAFRPIIKKRNLAAGVSSPHSVLFRKTWSPLQFQISDGITLLQNIPRYTSLLQCATH